MVCVHGTKSARHLVQFCTLTTRNGLDVSAAQSNTSPIYGKVGSADRIEIAISLHLPHGYRTLNIPADPSKPGLPGKYRNETIGLSLFDMENDPMETTNVLEKYPEVTQTMQGIAAQHKAEFFPNQK